MNGERIDERRRTGGTIPQAGHSVAHLFCKGEGFMGTTEKRRTDIGKKNPVVNKLDLQCEENAKRQCGSR